MAGPALSLSHCRVAEGTPHTPRWQISMPLYTAFCPPSFVLLMSLAMIRSLTIRKKAQSTHVEVYEQCTLQLALLDKIFRSQEESSISVSDYNSFFSERKKFRIV